MSRLRFLILAPLSLACSSPQPSPADPDLNAGNPSAQGRHPDMAAAATRVRVHLPDDSTLPSLRGSVAPLRWDQGLAMTRVSPGLYELTLPGLHASADFKPLLADSTWSLGQNYHISPGQTVEICPHFTPQGGAWSRRWPDGTSTPLGDRGVWLYTPPSLTSNPGCRYPVIYMHDGQNLFDPAYSFNGVTWQVGTSLDVGANAPDPTQAIPEVIVIGVENAGTDRINEYTPVPDPMYGGGDGDAYLAFLGNTVKPFIDQQLPTRPEAAATAMMGSSLGGLITAYAGLSWPATYQRVGILSPSTWWDNDWLIGQVQSRGAAAPLTRVYVDSGDSPAPDGDDVNETQMLAAAYQQVGYGLGVTLMYLVQAGGQHSEAYWAQRFPGAMRFLLNDL